MHITSVSCKLCMVAREKFTNLRPVYTNMDWQHGRKQQGTLLTVSNTRVYIYMQCSHKASLELHYVTKLYRCSCLLHRCGSSTCVLLHLRFSFHREHSSAATMTDRNFTGLSWPCSTGHTKAVGNC